MYAQMYAMHASSHLWCCKTCKVHVILPACRYLHALRIQRTHYLPEAGRTAFPSSHTLATSFLALAPPTQGINDRFAMGGWRAMAAYFLRYYSLHARLWEPDLPDYNHLWAETWLNMTLIAGRYTVLRLPYVFNATELNEVPKPGTYLGDDAARRRLAPAQGVPLLAVRSADGVASIAPVASQYNGLFACSIMLPGGDAWRDASVEAQLDSHDEHERAE